MTKLFSSHSKGDGAGLARAIALCALLLPAGAPSQSLWRDDISRSMVADKRAAGVGDILTIAVQENTTASKNNQTATAKQSSVDANITTFFYSPTASSALTKEGQLPALKFNSKSDFAGGGSIDNTEKIVTYVAALVIDVLPNRNLVIEGRRETAFGGEQQTIVLRGIVRTEDINANNTVFSYNIADASVHIVSKGAITDSQRKGWFHRVWDRIAPF